MMPPPLPPAIFSPCRQYRYLLRRIVGFGEKQCLFIMLNPSTADEEQDDPTVRRCIGFAKLRGCGRLEVANLFAFRATDPKELYECKVGSILLGEDKGIDPVGWENDHFIAAGAMRANIVVAAWGNHGEFQDRGVEVLRLIDFAKHRTYHLGRTASGHPKHPLYLLKRQELFPIDLQGDGN